MKNRSTYFSRLCRRACAAGLCLLLVLGFAPRAEAAGMTAAIAAGPVTLNGQAIDNRAARYPLLLYKNITYFPMTYHLCRFLGVEAVWDGTSGTLSISCSGVNAPYVADTGGTGRRGAVSVTRVNYSVAVNGIPADNSQAVWPLINYDGITYFPLTWQFAVDAFGWQYAWDTQNGLRINSGAACEFPQETDTGGGDLNAALAALHERYAAGGAYSGTLVGPDTKTVQAFDAVAAAGYSTTNLVVRLTADPFLFFPYGVSVAATYVGGDLSADPLLSMASAGSSLEAEKAMLAFSGTELGYLSCCFLDLQFHGSRTEKITSARLVSSEGGRACWALEVDFDYNAYSGYSAELIVDTSQHSIASIQLQTENYTLILIPIA